MIFHSYVSLPEGKHPQKPKVVVEWSKHSEPRHGAQCACTASPRRLCPSLNLAVRFLTATSPQGTVRDFLSMLMFKKNIKDINIIYLYNFIYVYNDYIIYIYD